MRNYNENTDGSKQKNFSFSNNIFNNIIITMFSTKKDNNNR